VKQTTQNKYKKLSQVGELAFIDLIRASLTKTQDTITGIGDDCAVVRLGDDSTEDIVLKSDPVIMGRHFLPDTPPRLVGQKAVGRVLSDIASMGATPRWLLIDLAAPADTTLKYADEVFKGMQTLADKHNCTIVGGDTSKSGELQIHVFGCGTVPRNTARLRSAAQEGDIIRVTGELGGSLNSGRHLSFSPRVAEGQWLRCRVNSMIDISDGLASELWHLARESKASLMLAPSCVPFTAAAMEDPRPLDRALYDGEDFELLFTLAPEQDALFDDAWNEAFPELKCTRIGKVISKSEPGVVFTTGESVPEKGFDHFATDTN
jgi:thiamine-monophosphate kinase